VRLHNQSGVFWDCDGEFVLLNAEKILGRRDVLPSLNICDCEPVPLPQVTRGVQKSEREFEWHVLKKSNYVPCVSRNRFEYFVAHNVAGSRDGHCHWYIPKY
jgi:hypothetical protein